MTAPSNTESEDHQEAIADVGSDVAAAAAGAGIGLIGGPIGSVIGAAVAPLIARGVQLVLSAYAQRQWARAERLIRLAANIADIDDSVLLERMQRSPELEDIFVRTLRAAAEASVERKLLALARSLAALATDGVARMQWETVFVRVVADLDDAHVSVLERFTRSANELGLGDGGPEFQDPPASLNAVQLDLAIPDPDGIRDSLLATLVQHGLLAYATHTAATFGGGSPLPATWSLTEFGRAVLRRLDVVDELLES
jgi:hypothetical protein